MVSIVIPTYNRSKTILRALNSVLEQTYNDIEVLVVDDGSTDDTRNVIACVHDKRVKYIYQENCGACEARNIGILNSKGDLIAFQDSDDYWHKDKLEKQINVMNETESDVVFCKLNQIVNDKVVKVKPSYCKGGRLNPVENIFNIGTQTIMAKRSVFDNNLFNSDLKRFQDLEWLYRISLDFKISCCDEGLVDYYVGNDSISKSSEKLYDACERIIYLHNELPVRMPKLANDISWTLYLAAVSEKIKGNNLYKQLLILSKRFNKSLKFALICSFFKLGIYWGD